MQDKIVLPLQTFTDAQMQDRVDENANIDHKRKVCMQVSMIAY
jgi:hypothetical protein